MYAMLLGRGMYRDAWPDGPNGVLVVPTDTVSRCILLPPAGDDRPVGECWEPCLDDLLLDDWCVTDERVPVERRQTDVL